MTVEVTNVSMSSTEMEKVAALVALILKNGGQTIRIDETTTPTAIPDVGQVYTKADNLPYFQDGAGTEKEIAIAKDTQLDLTEVSAPATAVDSVATLYTKSDNVLYFRDGAGTISTVDITGV